METDILIIGGGAAGMLAAIGASGNGAPSVTIIEKMPRPGRKIMISGKGRCNITNLKKWQDFSQHIHPKADFIKPAYRFCHFQECFAKIVKGECRDKQKTKFLMFGYAEPNPILFKNTRKVSAETNKKQSF